MTWTARLARRADARLNTRTEPVPLGPDSPHAVVIGAGFGGLAAAVRLLVRGYRVTVIDRLDQPGGRARVFREDGYTFDAGPTLITAPFLFEELWTLAGRSMADDVALVPIHPFYRIRFDDGDVFDYTGNAEAMRREIARFNPDDVAGYERFLAKSERIFEVGFEQLGHVPFGKVTDMARIAPATALGFACTAAWMPVYSQEWLWLCVLLIFIALGTLLWAAWTAYRGNADLWTRTALGLHAGWLSIAAILNLAQALLGEGVLPADNQLGWSFGLLVVAAGLAFAANAALRGAFSYALAAAWGFAGVTVALARGDEAPSAGWTALALAIALVVQTVWLRRRGRGRTRGFAR